MEKAAEYKTLNEFYPFYLREHSHPTNKILHFIGTGLVLAIVVSSIIIRKPLLLWLCPVFGYGFAWVGHFFIEKNRPATFKYPLLSLLSDFRLFFDILRGKVKIKER